MNDRENSLRVRHQITVPSGTVPDQLDKITTAAVEQVSKDLRQEATFKSNHGMLIYKTYLDKTDRLKTGTLTSWYVLVLLLSMCDHCSSDIFNVNGLIFRFTRRCE